MARWPAIACLICMVAIISASAATAADNKTQLIAVNGPSREGNKKFSCKDTEGKRPACNSTCPDSCPRDCVALCPKCLTFCRMPVPATSPALFVFGDGELDVGNNNYLPGGSEIGEPYRGNHPYYGIDFPGGQATGRFSNGFNTADFIAKYMGFAMSPPAYKSQPSVSMGGFTGVNYACGMAGLQPFTFASLTFSLPEQLKYFSDTRAQLETKLGPVGVSDLLSKSLFLIWVGTMDFLDTLYPQDAKLTQLQRLIGHYGDTITTLHNQGARKFAIINLGLIGCGPTRHGLGSSGGCDDGLNSKAAEFNAALKPLMARLGAKLKGLRYSIADFNAFSNATFEDPWSAGFMDTHYACCMQACHVWPCSNRSQYWYWDEGYMTEQAAMVATAAFYDGPANYTTPINFKRLIENE